MQKTGIQRQQPNGDDIGPGLHQTYQCTPAEAKMLAAHALVAGITISAVIRRRLGEPMPKAATPSSKIRAVNAPLKNSL